METTTEKDVTTQILRQSKEYDSGLQEPPWYQDFLKNKSNYYRTFFIPKRELQKELSSGRKLPYPSNRIPASELGKWRKISAPIQCLKEFQVKVRDALYKRRPSKFDYCVKRKNRFMANQKIAGYKVVLAMDIKDAFPSTTNLMVERALQTEGFDSSDRFLISEISTVNGCLPQGSPCSPVLLNLCRKRLDYRIAGFIRNKYQGETAVYVDNYYLASDNPSLNKAIPILKSIARREGYQFPDKKIYLMRKGSRQGGLGLVATKRSDGSVTVQPQKSSRLKLRAMLHNGLKMVQSGQPPWDDVTISHVRGLVECYKGSIYYDRFRKQINAIDGRSDDCGKAMKPKIMTSAEAVNRELCKTCGKFHRTD